MPKKKKLNVVDGINSFQRAFLMINPSTYRINYKYFAADVFDGILGDPVLTKQQYIDLYENLTDEDKVSISSLLMLIKDDVRVESRFDEDEKGTFAEYCVADDTNIYSVKIHAPIAFLKAISVKYNKQGYDKPHFTLEDLYQEALK